MILPVLFASMVITLLSYGVRGIIPLPPVPLPAQTFPGWGWCEMAFHSTSIEFLLHIISTYFVIQLHERFWIFMNLLDHEVSHHHGVYNQIWAKNLLETTASQTQVTRRVGKMTLETRACIMRFYCRALTANLSQSQLEPTKEMVLGVHSVLDNLCRRVCLDNGGVPL